jgi:hypothetical protein
MRAVIGIAREVVRDKSFRNKYPLGNHLIPIVLVLSLHACNASKTCATGSERWNSELKHCEVFPRDNRVSRNSIDGEWHVVSFENPGITALTQRDAKKWIGRVAYFSDSLVSFAGARCVSPTYVLDTITGSEFAEGSRFYPSELGLGDTVMTTEVRCPGQWTAPGSLLYHRGSELLALWDGTYFVLRRR